MSRAHNCPQPANLECLWPDCDYIGCPVKNGFSFVGKLGYFLSGDGRVCFAEVKAGGVNLPWESDMLEVLYQKWPDAQQQKGFIPRAAFHVLRVNTAVSQPGPPLPKT